jgi:hypothetical protein
MGQVHEQAWKHSSLTYEPTVQEKYLPSLHFLQCPLSPAPHCL